MSEWDDDDVLEVVCCSDKPQFEPFFSKDDFIREVRKATRTKSREWAYEEEVRLLIAVTRVPDDFLLFDGSAVRGVYLGSRISEPDVAEVAHILSAPAYSNTVLYQTFPDEKEYRISFSKTSI